MQPHLGAFAAQNAKVRVGADAHWLLDVAYVSSASAEPDFVGGQAHSDLDVGLRRPMASKIAAMEDGLDAPAVERRMLRDRRSRLARQHPMNGVLPTVRSRSRVGQQTQRQLAPLDRYRAGGFGQIAEHPIGEGDQEG